MWKLFVWLNVVGLTSLSACAPQQASPPTITTYALRPTPPDYALQDELRQIRVKASDVNALVDYIQIYADDPVMQPQVLHAQRQLQEKCAEVEFFYQAMPIHSETISKLSEDYSYACPDVVARYLSQHSPR